MRKYIGVLWGIGFAVSTAQAQTTLSKAPQNLSNPAGFEVGTQTEMLPLLKSKEIKPTASDSKKTSILPPLPSKNTTANASQKPVLAKLPKAKTALSPLKPQKVSGWGGKSVWGAAPKDSILRKNTVPKTAVQTQLKSKATNGWGKKSVWGKATQKVDPRKNTAPKTAVQTQLKPKATSGWGKKSVWGKAKQKVDPSVSAKTKTGTQWGTKSVFDSSAGPQQKRLKKPQWEGLKRRQKVPQIGYMTPQGTVVGNGNPRLNHPDDHDPFAQLPNAETDISLN